MRDGGCGVSDALVPSLCRHRPGLGCTRTLTIQGAINMLRISVMPAKGASSSMGANKSATMSKPLPCDKIHATSGVMMVMMMMMISVRSHWTAWRLTLIGMSMTSCQPLQQLWPCRSFALHHSVHVLWCHTAGGVRGDARDASSVLVLVHVPTCATQQVKGAYFDQC